MDLHLNPDGPRTPDYTTAVALGLTECVRVLNSHTRDAAALPDPQTIYEVLGDLHAGAAKSDQLLQQISRRLGELLESDRLADDRGNPTGSVLAAVNSLEAARSAAYQLASHLERAHLATATLHLREGQ
ncbi:hypothetical protein [Acrocarpospora catenulata]|uniref:hypothetical protein n=1 Tax=Acrocarpospora catenulata TaxID=2836182 RepID=UPI001BD96498|nr:hypothetical protein [Acrocarpospora catenulata]